MAASRKGGVAEPRRCRPREYGITEHTGPRESSRRRPKHRSPSVRHAPSRPIDIAVGAARCSPRVARTSVRSCSGSSSNARRSRRALRRLRKRPGVSNTSRLSTSTNVSVASRYSCQCRRLNASRWRSGGQRCCLPSPAASWATGRRAPRRPASWSSALKAVSARTRTGEVDSTIVSVSSSASDLSVREPSEIRVKNGLVASRHQQRPFLPKRSSSTSNPTRCDANASRRLRDAAELRCDGQHR